MNAEHTDRSVVESVSSSSSSSIENVTSECNESPKHTTIQHFNEQIGGIDAKSNAINDMEEDKTSGSSSSSNDSNARSGQEKKCCEQIASQNTDDACATTTTTGGAKCVESKEVNATDASINNNNNNNNNISSNNNNNNNNGGEAAVAKILLSVDGDAPSSANESICDVNSTAKDIKKLKHVQGRSNSTGKLYHASRRVSFPENDSELVTGYLEPANPWACGQYSRLFFLSIVSQVSIALTFYAFWSEYTESCVGFILFQYLFLFCCSLFSFVQWNRRHVYPNWLNFIVIRASTIMRSQLNRSWNIWTRWTWIRIRDGPYLICANKI